MSRYLAISFISGSFPLSLRSVAHYFRLLLTRSPQHYPGHNPAGSWAIYAMLAMAILAGATGYATYNEVGGEWLAELHEGAANAMLGVVLIHIGGVILSSLIHRENLVAAMLSGYKQGRLRDGIRSKHTFVAAALLLATLGYWAGGADLLPAPWGGAPGTAKLTLKGDTLEFSATGLGITCGGTDYTRAP